MGGSRRTDRFTSLYCIYRLLWCSWMIPVTSRMSFMFYGGVQKCPAVGIFYCCKKPGFLHPLFLFSGTPVHAKNNAGLAKLAVAFSFCNHVQVTWLAWLDWRHDPCQSIHQCRRSEISRLYRGRWSKLWKTWKRFLSFWFLLLQLLYQRFCLSWDSDTTSHLHLKNEYDIMSIILFNF